ncbi:hypothetical protein [Tabrizicola sp.]|uniref:hypothetical protein n=1 Tax=Tabrizicola sp. TaxID=2005166 RepID=UPI00286BD937|nr:hypothetical protein [Tabrizicola sp.]
MPLLLHLMMSGMPIVTPYIVTTEAEKMAIHARDFLDPQPAFDARLRFGDAAA